MKLSPSAIQELRTILKSEIGNETITFSDEDIEKLGIKLLKLTGFFIKRKSKSS